jgi:hypothetical protein
VHQQALQRKEATESSAANGEFKIGQSGQSEGVLEYGAIVHSHCE